jgi:hypothetical protein
MSDLAGDEMGWAMTDIERLQRMIDDLRRLRNSCEPKSNQNPRYLRYSNAISSLLWIISDLQAEEPRELNALNAAIEDVHLKRGDV